MTRETPETCPCCGALRTVQPADELLTFDEVSAFVRLGRTAIYKHLRAGDFPRPFKPGGFSSRWSRRELVTWLEKARSAAPANDTGRP